MTRTHVMLTAAACAVVVALAGTALVVRRSRAAVRPVVAPDTVIAPLVNGAMNNRVITSGNERFFYKVFLPADYTPARKWPVIFALHGGRTRGYDNVTQAKEGLANVVRQQAATFPAIVIFPQIPTRARGYEFIPVDIAMMDRELKDLNGDPDRLYLAGASFGGFTVFQLAYAYPTKFAALVPVSAGIDMSTAPGRAFGPDSVYAAVARRLKPLPIWMFHGERDEELGVASTRLIVKTFHDASYDIRYTEIPNAPHTIFTRAWETPELLPWLLAQRRGRPDAGATPR